jgi:hypothetical protein
VSWVSGGADGGVCCSLDGSTILALHGEFETLVAVALVCGLAGGVVQSGVWSVAVADGDCPFAKWCTESAIGLQWCCLDVFLPKFSSWESGAWLARPFQSCLGACWV